MAYAPLLTGHVESITRGIQDQNGTANGLGLQDVNPVFTWSAWRNGFRCASISTASPPASAGRRHDLLGQRRHRAPARTPADLARDPSLRRPWGAAALLLCRCTVGPDYHRRARMSPPLDRARGNASRDRAHRGAHGPLVGNVSRPGARPAGERGVRRQPRSANRGRAAAGRARRARGTRGHAGAADRRHRRGGHPAFLDVRSSFHPSPASPRATGSGARASPQAGSSTCSAAYDARSRGRMHCSAPTSRRAAACCWRCSANSPATMSACVRRSASSSSPVATSARQGKISD